MMALQDLILLFLSFSIFDTSSSASVLGTPNNIVTNSFGNVADFSKLPGTVTDHEVILRNVLSTLPKENSKQLLQKLLDELNQINDVTTPTTTSPLFGDNAYLTHTKLKLKVQMKLGNPSNQDTMNKKVNAGSQVGANIEDEDDDDDHVLNEQLANNHFPDFKLINPVTNQVTLSQDGGKKYYIKDSNNQIKSQVMKFKLKFPSINNPDGKPYEIYKKSPSNSEDEESTMSNIWKSALPIMVKSASNGFNKDEKVQAHPHVDFNDITQVLPDMKTMMEKLLKVHEPGHFTAILLNPDNINTDREVVKKTKICCEFRKILLDNGKLSNDNGDADQDQMSYPFQKFESLTPDDKDGSNTGLPFLGLNPSQNNVLPDDTTNPDWDSDAMSTIKSVMKKLHLFYQPNHLSGISFNPKEKGSTARITHIRILIKVPLQSSEENTDSNNKIPSQDELSQQTTASPSVKPVVFRIHLGGNQQGNSAGSSATPSDIAPGDKIRITYLPLKKIISDEAKLPENSDKKKTLFYFVFHKPKTTGIGATGASGPTGPSGSTGSTGPTTAADQGLLGNSFPTITDTNEPPTGTDGFPSATTPDIFPKFNDVTTGMDDFMSKIFDNFMNGNIQEPKAQPMMLG